MKAARHTSARSHWRWGHCLFVPAPAANRRSTTGQWWVHAVYSWAVYSLGCVLLVCLLLVCILLVCSHLVCLPCALYHVLFTLALPLQLEAGNAERDHEWLVEQLPGDAGYRVYQSYMWAYRQACVAFTVNDSELVFKSGSDRVERKAWTDGRAGVCGSFRI